MFSEKSNSYKVFPWFLYPLVKSFAPRCSIVFETMTFYLMKCVFVKLSVDAMDFFVCYLLDNSYKVHVYMVAYIYPLAQTFAPRLCFKA